MTQERWEDIKAMVKDKFDSVIEKNETLAEDQGPGEVEVLEFDGPIGKMRLTWTTQPLVLDKKVLGSRRIGGESTVQYTYSDTEKTHKFTVYKYNQQQGDWDEMQKEQGEMIF